MLPLHSQKVRMIQDMVNYAEALGTDPLAGAAVLAMKDAIVKVNAVDGRTPCSACLDITPGTWRCARWGEVVPAQAREAGCPSWCDEVPF